MVSGSDNRGCGSQTAGDSLYGLAGIHLPFLGARTFPREACLRTSAPAVFGAASHYAERRRVHDGVAAIEGCSVLGPRPCPGKVTPFRGSGTVLARFF